MLELLLDHKEQEAGRMPFPTLRLPTPGGINVSDGLLIAVKLGGHLLPA